MVTAWWEASADRLHLWTPTQVPRPVIEEVAQLLGLPLESVVCHEVGVGGGFGARSQICEYEAIAACLSRKVGRRVNIKLSREEEFEVTRTRHAF